MTNAVDLLGLTRGLDVGNDNQTSQQPLDGERSLNPTPIQRDDTPVLAQDANRVSPTEFDVLYGNVGPLWSRTATPSAPPSASNPVNRRR